MSNTEYTVSLSETGMNVSKFGSSYSHAEFEKNCFPEKANIKALVEAGNASIIFLK